MSVRSGRQMLKISYWNDWHRKDADAMVLHNSLQRMLKTGYIEKIIKNNIPYIRLTNKAHEKLKRDFSLLWMQKERWDGKWRLVFFDIKEKRKNKRDSLRKKLLELGFAMLQKSTYISPHKIEADIYEFI